MTTHEEIKQYGQSLNEWAFETNVSAVTEYSQATSTLVALLNATDPTQIDTLTKQAEQAIGCIKDTADDMLRRLRHIKGLKQCE